MSSIAVDARLWRQRQRDDRHVVDAAADDQRLGDAGGNAVIVGANFLVHAQDRIVRRGADEEARGDEDPVVDRVGVDVLDAVDRLDDGLERLGDELDGVLGLEAVGRDEDIDHRHRDLRLFLARQSDERDEAERQGRQQKQRRQRRGDEGAGEVARETRAVGPGSWLHQPVAGREPARISIVGSSPALAARPVCTTTSVVVPSFPARRT